MKIYTRTGDAGVTGLRGGVRVAKTDGRVVVCGELDELNAMLGLAASLSSDDELRSVLHELQETLLSLGAEVAQYGSAAQAPMIDHSAVTALEKAIDGWQAGLPPLERFILPGGTPVAAALHASRAVCRRAERAMVLLSANVAVNPVSLALVNRMSDLLFVLARAANSRAGVPDAIWHIRDT